MSSTIVRLAGFAAALAVAFGGAALAGAAIDPDRAEPAPEHMPAADSAHSAPAHPVRGLAVADDGMRLVVETPDLRRGETETLRFRIVDERGDTVRDFDVEHEKRMHLIVARRDLTGFQHLHPVQAADGTWSTRARLDDAGSYRLFADFTRDEDPVTLAGDLRVDGAADLEALPEPSPTAATATGYRVRMEDDRGVLRFAVTKDGKAVETEPYLGAGGHLVALREGDLAFLHVHPQDNGVAFEATFPTDGRYRLFLQFKHAGRVHTATFTKVVA